MSDEEVHKRLLERLIYTNHLIEAACWRAQRERKDITFVVVTKSAPARVTAMLPSCGYFDLGEARLDGFRDKMESLQDGRVRWHMIGHLQRNKIRHILPLAHRIHAIDSVQLLNAVDAEAKKQNRTVTAFLEVNASRENTKYGFAPEEVPGLREAVEKATSVRIDGLMTMAADVIDLQIPRATFQELRSLRDRLQIEWGETGKKIVHLSMGMSNDFEVAIEEGATFVRIGSRIFDELEIA